MVISRYSRFDGVVCNAEKRKRIKKKNLDRGFDLGSYWRRGRDSNPRYVLAYARFPSVCLRPLNHLSVRPNALQQKRFYHKYAKKAIVFRYVFPNSGGKFLSRRRGHLSLRIRTALYAATACIAPARGASSLSGRIVTDANTKRRPHTAKAAAERSAAALPLKKGANEITRFRCR